MARLGILRISEWADDVAALRQLSKAARKRRVAAYVAGAVRLALDGRETGQGRVHLDNKTTPQAKKESPQMKKVPRFSDVEAPPSMTELEKAQLLAVQVSSDEENDMDSA